MKYGMIDSLRQQYPVALMCRVLDVSESGFHAWNTRPPCERKKENTRLEVEILAAHQRTRETYGTKRLYRELVDYGVHNHSIPCSNASQKAKFVLQAETQIQGNDQF